MDTAERKRLTEALNCFVQVLEDVAMDAKLLQIREQGLYGDGSVLEVTLVRPDPKIPHYLEVTEVKITISQS